MSKSTGKRKKKLFKASLIAFATESSSPANIDVKFTSGLGQLTASLFRNGVLINLQSISSSGVIALNEVQSGDAISINGVCTGTADISVTVPVDPSSPQHFDAGNINFGFDIL